MHNYYTNTAKKNKKMLYILKSLISLKYRQDIMKGIIEFAFILIILLIALGGFLWFSSWFDPTINL